MKTAKNFASEACPVWWRGPGECKLQAEMRPGYRIVVTLGSIKKKNDGRWNWYFTVEKHGMFTAPTIPEKLQGTVATKEEAQQTIEQLWGIQDERR